jgi:hypothetical protein
MHKPKRSKQKGIEEGIHPSLDRTIERVTAQCDTMKAKEAELCRVAKLESGAEPEGGASTLC